MDRTKIKRVLFVMVGGLSPSTELVELARELASLDVDLLGTEEAAAALRAAGLGDWVREVELELELTAILSQSSQMPGLVVLDLPNLGMESKPELGARAEALLLAALERNLPLLIDPGDYRLVMEELRQEGGLSPETSRRLVRRAVNHLLRYSLGLATALDEGEPLPTQLAFFKALNLPERADGPAALYTPHGVKMELPRLLHGPPFGYEDLLDLGAAWEISQALEEPTAVIIKHGEPCGLASGETLEEAFVKAYSPVGRSAEWGLVGLNRPLTPEVAALLAKYPIGGLLAPACPEEALAALKFRKGFRVFVGGKVVEGSDLGLKETIFGLVVRPGRAARPKDIALKVVSRRPPTAAEEADLLFAWRALAWFRPEAALLVRDKAVIGLGAGQASLIEAVTLAIRRAGPLSKGAVLTSPTLPDRDPLDLAAAARLTGVVTSSTLKDEKGLVRAADEHGLALVLVDLS